MRFLIALLTCLLPTVAAAAPITVSAGESATFNFDFVAAGVSPAPPYDMMEFFVNTAAGTLDGGDVGGFSVVSGLNGGGSLLFTEPVWSSGFNSNDLRWTDGIFSVVLSMSAGSITVDPVAGAIVSGARRILAPQPAAVPEPASLLLLTSGLAATAIRARRRRKQGQYPLL